MPPRSDKSDKGPSQPPQKKPHSLLMWVLALLLLFMAIQALFPSARQELNYSEFRYKVERGDIIECQLGPSTIIGTMKAPQETVAEEDPGKKALTVLFSVDRYGVADPELTALLQKHHVTFKGEKEASWLQGLLIWVLGFGALIAVWFFLFRRMGPAGSAMSFSRSKGKLLAQEDLGVTFEDVAGIDEAKAELVEIVDFLRTPERYAALGGKIPKGVLLVGAPGTGKTLLAKAVAGEANVPFFSISGSDFVEMFVGVGAARVRDMFAQAGQRAPCIIFIDELDALGKARGISVVGGHDEREQTLNQLLVQMDGFDSNKGVIIMGATNRPEILDPALLRPGRFDRHVVVDRPDLNGRESILKVHAKNIKLDPSVDMRNVARITPGFVGADLANLVNEAALLAAREGRRSVTQEYFEQAVDRVVAGLEKKNRLINPKEKERVAYHETGHAVVACVVPGTDPVHKVSIIPRGIAALGYTMQRPADDRYLITQSEIEGRIKGLLGGTIAEEIVFHEVSTGAQNDLQRATDLARSMVVEFGMSPKLGRVNLRDRAPRNNFLGPAAGMPGEREYSETTAREIDLEVKRIIDEASVEVREILEARRDEVERVAKVLIEKEILEGIEVRQMLGLQEPDDDEPPVEVQVIEEPAEGSALPPSREQPFPEQVAKAKAVRPADAPGQDGSEDRAPGQTEPPSAPK